MRYLTHIKNDVVIMVVAGSQFIAVLRYKQALSGT